MIDFSMIPPARKPTSPWRDVLIAVSIVLTMLVYMLFVFFVLHIDDPNVGVAPVSIALSIGVTGSVIWAFVVAFRKSSKQTRLMAEFARVNNFVFEKPKKLAYADSSYNPPNSTLISERIVLKYRVAGEVNGRAFELYRLWGGTRANMARGIQLGFMTVLRTPYPLMSASGEYITVESQGSYGYVSIRGNAFTRELLQEMFAPLASSN